MLINGFQEARTNKALIKYHVIIFSSPAPLSKLPVENAAKFTLSILLLLFLNRYYIIHRIGNQKLNNIIITYLYFQTSAYKPNIT